MNKKKRDAFGFYPVIPIVILLLMAVFNFSHAATTDPKEECLRCHGNVWEREITKMFIHQPFLEQKCYKCHVELPTREVQLMQTTEQQGNRRGIRWIKRELSPALTRWYKVPADMVSRSLFIEAYANRGKVLTQFLKVPPQDELQKYNNERTPLKISNVKVVSVCKGVFITATISWETNTVASSSVLYGTDELNFSSGTHKLTTSHQVALTGLSPRTTYQYRILSEDVFGNKTASDVFTLSTSSFFSVAAEQPLGAVKDIGDVQIKMDIYNIDEDYLIKIGANQPVKLNLGATPALRKTEPGETESPSNKPQEIRHILTVDKFNLNLSTCYSCHHNYLDSRNHPVNVFPKLKMKIPSEYPTLADGRISCMSCHTSHASNTEHRLIKPPKELCEGCHAGFSGQGFGRQTGLSI